MGKSRLAREFVSTLEGATVLVGRSLPYGEGITYWPLAEMVKAAAGISDDDDREEAQEKLMVFCEDEEVADLLGLASGVLDSFDDERSQQEIQWAVREWAERLAGEQPLVLGFEDIHWAEEPLLELIEHLAGWVREAPLLIVCLARPELLDQHPSWGGGRTRALSIELEPLGRGDAEELASALTADTPLTPELREAVLDKTEGNPLFLEETVRMLVQGDDGHVERIPDTLQALIAARIDLLPASQKTLMQRASVIGRTFWHGAVEHLSPDVEDVGDVVEELLLRDFVLREPRSTLSGDRAYRFKHVLIRDVAYSGLPKAARAELHVGFANWLHERAGEELLEIRASHLDRAASLTAELEGSVPPELASEAAAALEAAGARALAREANTTARRLLLRATELEPTLVRRHKAAVAAWRLADFAAVAMEMDAVRQEAIAANDQSIHGRALTALADVTLVRDADLPRAGELAELALSVLPEDDLVGRFDALGMRASIAWWLGDLSGNERYAREALELAQRLGRKDLESEAAQQVAADEARPPRPRGRGAVRRPGLQARRGEREPDLAGLGARVARAPALDPRPARRRAGGARAGASALRGGRRRVDARAHAQRARLDRVAQGRPQPAPSGTSATRSASSSRSRSGPRCARASAASRSCSRRRASSRRRSGTRSSARETVGQHDQSSRATTRMALAVVRAGAGPRRGGRGAVPGGARRRLADGVRVHPLRAADGVLALPARAGAAPTRRRRSRTSSAGLGEVTWGQPDPVAATARMV